MKIILLILFSLVKIIVIENWVDLKNLLRLKLYSDGCFFYEYFGFVFLDCWYC